MKKLQIFLIVLALALAAFGQQPQTSDVTNTQPLYAINSKYTNGVGPGYWPTAGAVLVLNLSSGTSFCSGTVNNYAGGTLTMTGNTTNYIYLNTASSCVPAVKTTAFTSYDIPIAIVTATTSITGITDVRTHFFLRFLDFPDFHTIPAANCNNVTGGNGWSIGSGGTVSCRAGTNNFGGYILITDTSSTFATFQVPLPEDWDTTSNPSIRFQIASTDATNGHTIIPSIQVACYKGDGSTTDDVAPNAAHSLSTISLNGNANRFWSTSNIQMNSTDMTGCVAGAMMQITVGRATDTATNAEFYSATITIPRLLTAGAN